jgi:arginine decarboxylase
MLSFSKVTILTPGINPQTGNMQSWGIPAPILTYFLETRGIVDEKSGFYSFLMLFSIGITKGQSSVLISSLLEFKNLYDSYAPLDDILPNLVRRYPYRFFGERILVKYFNLSHLLKI